MDTLKNRIETALVEGTQVEGLIVLWALASAVLIPLALYRPEFNFSVGYTFSIFDMGAVLLTFFYPESVKSLVATAVTFQGFRLWTYLVARRVLTDMHKKKQQQDEKGFDPTNLIKRPLVSMVFGLLYASMVAPVLFALRDPPPPGTAASQISLVGGIMAWFGTLLETLADFQKFVAKQRHAKDKQKTFVGPTSWAYRLCRHPNYLGESMLYTGLFVGGVPSFDTILPWVTCGFGLLSILSVMNMATKRLEKKQQEAYSGQAKYEAWTAQVKAPLIPFITA